MWKLHFNDFISGGLHFMLLFCVGPFILCVRSPAGFYGNVVNMMMTLLFHMLPRISILLAAVCEI